MYPVLLLHWGLSELVVARPGLDRRGRAQLRTLSRTSSAAASMALARRTPRLSTRHVSTLSLPYHHELHPDLPEGPQSWTGHWADQAGGDGAPAVNAVADTIT